MPMASLHKKSKVATVIQLANPSVSQGSANVTVMAAAYRTGDEKIASFARKPGLRI
jgi:hypothetical protein